MKAFRTEINIVLLISVLTIGAIVFFLSRMDREQSIERTDLYDLVLPDPQMILSINKTQTFAAMLKRQSQLDAYFKSVIPDEYFELLSHVKNSSALLAYYPQGVLLFYQLSDADGKPEKYFQAKTSFSVKKDGIQFYYLPKAPQQYLGYYHHNGVCVSSNSRKLLENVASTDHSKADQDMQRVKTLRDGLDKNALLNCFLHIDSGLEWQAIDLFMHEEQVCFLLNQPFVQMSDSLISATADSLSLSISRFIPGLEFETGYSQDDSSLFYTFCAPLLSRH